MFFDDFLATPSMNEDGGGVFDRLWSVWNDSERLRTILGACGGAYWPMNAVSSGLQEDETKFALPVSFLIRREGHTRWDGLTYWT